MKKNYVIFTLEQDRCAVDIDNVIEVIEVDFMVKTATDQINVIYWRNMSLPVLDILALKGLYKHRLTADSRIIILEEEGIKYGMLVNEIGGIKEFDMNQIEEPGLTAPRYVEGVMDKIKIIKPTVFLHYNKILENFKKVYALELEHLQKKGEMVEGIRKEGRDEVIEQIRIATLNWTVKAIKENINTYFLNEMTKIHHLAESLK